MGNEHIFLQYFAGIILFSVTTVLQATVTTAALFHGRWYKKVNTGLSLTSVILVFWAWLAILMIGAILVSNLWAAYYYYIGAFDTFYKSLFFSMSCFTTLGFSNFLPDNQFVILASLEGISGSLTMGWVGGVILWLMQTLNHGLQVHRESKTKEKSK